MGWKEDRGPRQLDGCQLFQSHWSRSCNPQQQKDALNAPLQVAPTSPAAFFASEASTAAPGAYPELHGSILAVLEAHQKRSEGYQAQILARLSDIEARLLQMPEHCYSEPHEDAFSPRHVGREPEQEAQGPVADNQSGAKGGPCLSTNLSSNISPRGSGPEGDRGPLRRLQHRVRACVRSSRFEVFVALLIVVSVFFSFLELEWEGYLADEALGLAPPGGWHGAEFAFAIVGHVFNSIFLLEFLLRWIAGGKRYLRDPWAWFDGFFLLAALLDDYLVVLLHESARQNFGVVRLVRCARLVRTFRASRSVRAVRPLLLLVQTILSSMSALLWSSLALFLVQLMGTIFITKSLHGFVMDETNPEEDRLFVNKIFGSGLKSIYTFFEITFSGGWPNHVRPLMERAGAQYALFFVFYVAIWTFVIMRVIGALFIKETLATAEKVEHKRQSHEGERKKMMRKIANYFKAADVDHNGRLSWQELQHLFEDRAVKSWCASHEIDLDDAQNLWTILSSKGALNVTEFVDGMLRMREPAKAIDLKAVLQTTKGLEASCENISEKVAAMDLKIASLETRRRSGRCSQSSAS